MIGKRTVVTEVSTRSPRDSWRRPRSTSDVITILERNGFLSSNVDNGVAFVRHCGVLSLRVTLANGGAILETAMRVDGRLPRWRRSREPRSQVPWEVAREALELLATIDVDTPIRWG